MFSRLHTLSCAFVFVGSLLAGAGVFATPGRGAAQGRVEIAVEDVKAYTRTEDVIYGRKDGVALTMDVFKPAKANGAAIIEIVSGGYFSSHAGVQVSVIESFLKRGYTVFCVVHGSQPRYQVPEIFQDIQR